MLGLLLTATVAAATPASAHDELLNATPRAGATVGRLPADIRLAFDDQVLADLSVVRVVGPDGSVLSSGPATAAGTVVTQRTAGVARVGTYRLAYRVVSADGHPVSGGWSFTVTRASTVGAPGAAGSGPGDPGSSHAPELLALGVLVIGGAGSLLLRSRVIRRAQEAESAHKSESADTSDRSDDARQVLA